MMQELYNYLLQEVELTGNLNLKENCLIYSRFNLENNVTDFYGKCIEDKNLINDKLPSGFKLTKFNYESDYVSFIIIVK